jgi:hypothetical protein
MSTVTFDAAGSVEPVTWQRPQTSLVSGLVGRASRGSVMCRGSTVWQLAQGNSAWVDMAFVCSMRPWQPVHSVGAFGGTGSCGS